MIRVFSTALIMCLAAQRAAACAACFGKSDAPLAEGMNAGIFVMLGFVILAWIAFGSFFVFIARRARSNSTDGTEGSESIPNVPSSSSDLQ